MSGVGDDWRRACDDWQRAWDTFDTAQGEPLAARAGWAGVTPVPLPTGMREGAVYGARIEGDRVTWFERDAGGWREVPA